MARAGQPLVKDEFIFYIRMLQLSKFVQNDYQSKILLRLNMHKQRSVLKKDTKN